MVLKLDIMTLTFVSWRQKIMIVDRDYQRLQENMMNIDVMSRTFVTFPTTWLIYGYYMVNIWRVSSHGGTVIKSMEGMDTPWL